MAALSLICVSLSETNAAITCFLLMTGKIFDPFYLLICRILFVNYDIQIRLCKSEEFKVSCMGMIWWRSSVRFV